MSQTQIAYEPKFPEAHALLLGVYKQAMWSEGEESVVWCERFKALSKSLEALRRDGVLPPLFTKHFWADVKDVMVTVHKNLDLSKLTEGQAVLTFGINTLQTTFGGP